MILPVAHIHIYIYILYYIIQSGGVINWQFGGTSCMCTRMKGGFRLPFFLVHHLAHSESSPMTIFCELDVYIYIYMLNDAKSLYQRVLWCKTLKWWRWWRLQVGRLPAKPCYLFHFITRFHHCHCSDSRKTCLIMVHRISLLNAQKYKVLSAKLVYNSND